MIIAPALEEDISFSDTYQGKSDVSNQSRDRSVLISNSQDLFFVNGKIKMQIPQFRNRKRQHSSQNSDKKSRFKMSIDTRPRYSRVKRAIY